MAGLTAGIISATASVGAAAGGASPTHRQCTIQIKNECHYLSLSNPRMYIVSGSCAMPLSPFIGPNKSDMALFIKTPHTACGSVGVFTYDLLKCGEDQAAEKIAVMFSVPYDFNVYSNWYAVGVFDKSRECDYYLYKEMYYDSSRSFIRREANGPGLIYKDSYVKIMATMSDAYQPVIKLQITCP